MRKYLYGPSTLPLFHLLWLKTVFCKPLPETNYFTNPVPGGLTNYFLDDLVWTVGDTQKITWVTNYTSYAIRLWQQEITRPWAHPITTVHSVGPNGDDAGSFDWTVSAYTTDLDFSPVYFFYLVPSDDPDAKFTSHYFNLTKSMSASTSTSTSTPTPNPDTTTASSALSSASTTSSGSLISDEATGSAEQASASADNGRHTTVIGLGVGLGVGIPLLLIFGVVLGYKLFKQRGKATNDALYAASSPPDGTNYEHIDFMRYEGSRQNAGSWPEKDDKNGNAVSELPPRPTSPAELSGHTW